MGQWDSGTGEEAMKGFVGGKGQGDDGALVVKL